MGIQSLVQCRFKNGMLMLPFFHRRIVDLNKCLDDEYDDDFFRKKSRSRLAYMTNLIKGLSHIKVRRCEILAFSSTLHNIESRGQICNKLIGAYDEMYKDRMLIMEDADANGIWKKRPDFSRVSYINTYFLFLSRGLSSFLNKIRVRRREDYQPFISSYPSYFDEVMLSQNDYFVSIYSFFIKWLLNITSPKLLLLEDASYGTEHAVICQLAKVRGIKVVEPQHGSTYGCSAYQTLESVTYNEEYYHYLPDCLFTFGDFWNSPVEWGYEKYAVGNAYLNKYKETCKHIVPEYDILVLSQPFKGVEVFIKKLSERLKMNKILLRLHPSENVETNRIIYEGNDNITLSHNTSLYDDIVNSRMVVGWASTCLYEALAFERVPVVIDSLLSRAQFPEDIGVWVKTPEEIADLDFDAINQSVRIDKYWKDSFESNVKAYFDKYIN